MRQKLLINFIENKRVNKKNEDYMQYTGKIRWIWFPRSMQIRKKWLERLDPSRYYKAACYARAKIRLKYPKIPRYRLKKLLRANILYQQEVGEQFKLLNQAKKARLALLSKPNSLGLVKLEILKILIRALFLQFKLLNQPKKARLALLSKPSEFGLVKIEIFRILIRALILQFKLLKKPKKAHLALLSKPSEFGLVKIEIFRILIRALILQFKLLNQPKKARLALLSKPSQFGLVKLEIFRILIRALFLQFENNLARSEKKKKIKSKDISVQSKGLTLPKNIVLQNNHNIEQEKINREKKREMLSENDIGRARQYLSATKEWCSSIYSYNSNEMKSLRGTDQSISKIIKSYFTSIPHWFITSREIKRAVFKKWRSKTNKVYTSKSEFKHTSSKVTITSYIYAERKVNLRYMYKFIDKDNFFYSIAKNKGLLTFHNFIDSYPDLAETSFFIRKVKKKFYQYLKLKKNYQNLKNFLVNKICLGYHKKKVEINIIRLKYLYLNNEMVTEYIVLKLIQKKRNLFRAKRKLFGKIRLPIVNKYDVNQITLAKKRIIMKSFRNQLPQVRNKHIWLDWKINKYFRPIVMDNLSEINDTYKDFLLFINYKYPIGIRLQIAGRLTKRNVASRSLKKFTYIGSIKNIDASFRNVSVSNIRTFYRPNIEFNKINSFARTGAFTVKSWLSNY